MTCGASSLSSISFCGAEGGFAKIISKRATWKSVCPGGTGISVARIPQKQQLWCWCVSPCPPAHLGRHRLPAGSSPLSLPPGHPEWPPLFLFFEVRAFSRGSASGCRYHTPPSRRPASSRRRGGELMGSLQARPLRFGGGSVLGPAQEPGQPLGVKAGAEGGTHAGHLPSAWPCVLPSVRVEGSLPLNCFSCPHGLHLPQEKLGPHPRGKGPG